jgi:hypothetical protein
MSTQCSKQCSMTDTEAYYVKLGMSTVDDHIHIILTIFVSYDDFQEHENNYFSDCRHQIQQWLDRHYAGDILSPDEDNIGSAD